MRGAVDAAAATVRRVPRAYIGLVNELADGGGILIVGGAELSQLRFLGLRLAHKGLQLCLHLLHLSLLCLARFLLPLRSRDAIPRANQEMSV